MCTISNRFDQSFEQARERLIKLISCGIGIREIILDRITLKLNELHGSGTPSVKTSCKRQ
jgi:hypothetical protein